MRTHRALLALATVAVCANCSSSTDSSPTGDIVGSWVSDSAASPTGYYVRQLVFTPSGKFASDFRSYGRYENQQPDDVSAYERTSGTFTVKDDQVIFEPSWLTIWDFSFGRDAPQTVYAPYPYDHFYDDAHYRVDGDELTLDFTLDVDGTAKPATQTFQRDS